MFLTKKHLNKLKNWRIFILSHTIIFISVTGEILNYRKSGINVIQLLGVYHQNFFKRQRSLWGKHKGTSQFD